MSFNFSAVGDRHEVLAQLASMGANQLHGNGEIVRDAAHAAITATAETASGYHRDYDRKFVVAASGHADENGVQISLDVKTHWLPPVPAKAEQSHHGIHEHSQATTSVASGGPVTQIHDVQI